MPMISIAIDSETLEEVLFALKLRACQKGVSEETKVRMEYVRRELNAQGERVLGWDNFPNRYKADDSIRVTITSRNRW